MKRMFANRAILLGAIVLFATALVGATGLFSRSEKPAPPAAASKPPAAPVALTAKQTPAQDPRCALQDKDDRDDDAKESKVKKSKPDTDDDELECGDQNDDDGGAKEDDAREHGKRGEHDKKALEKKAEPGKAGKAPAGR